MTESLPVIRPKDLALDRGVIDPGSSPTLSWVVELLDGRTRRRVLAVTVASLLVGWCTAAVAGARDSISTSDAAKHLDETATVCGLVASAKYVSTSKGAPDVLNLDKP